MRRAASWAVLGLLVASLAGCGGDHRLEGRVLDAFFTKTAEGRHWGTLFPHRPGTIPCTLRIGQPPHQESLEARCATDVSFVKHDRAVVTLTEAWGRAGLAHTWFFFIRRDGTIESIVQEGAPEPEPGDS